MKRKARFDTFKEAPSRGNYDEFPMLELGIDPQVHLSRNTVPQPFFLICEQDTVLAQLSGEARVEFRNSSVNFFRMVLGDYVYVPAGTPHRILPKERIDPAALQSTLPRARSRRVVRRAHR
jgi:3-hydroxyanthranilate 3,4-dioxygenase